MTWFRRFAAARAILLAALLLTGCAGVSPRQQAEVDRIVGAARPSALDCERADRCAHASALLAMADADHGGQHHALIIDHGQDALLARIHLIRAARETYGLTVEGLMCIPPAEEATGPHFALLRDIAERNGLSVLSMGMSGDYETAIRHGATHVRVGTALFGERIRPEQASRP